MAHAIGELVIYGTNGVCKIEDLRNEDFAGEARLYYILRPVAESGKTCIYVPADNELLVGGMRELLPADGLLAALAEAGPYLGDEWPSDGRGRNKRCKELLASGNRTALIRLIKTLKTESATRTLTAAEEAVCMRAASMLHQEFCLSFRITPAEMIPFIMGELAVERLAEK